MLESKISRAASAAMIGGAILALGMGCGKVPDLTTPSLLPPVAPPQVGASGPDGVVVKARAAIAVSTAVPSLGARLFGLIARAAYAEDSGEQPVSVTNAANTSMTISNAGWAVPAITNALLDFGHLDVSALLDNNLNLCGEEGRHHCGTALFRMYTTGADGAGLWNPADRYGAPITAGPASGALSPVGLGVDGATVIQRITIPRDKHALHLTDFSPAPAYEVKSDFTDAGAGSYGTTIVLEFALAP